MILESKNLQVRKIILESENKVTPVKKYLEDLYEDGKDFIKEKEVELGVDLKFLLTFGAAIPPLSKIFTEFYEFRYPELDSKDITLLVISLLSSVFFERRDHKKGIYDSIVEKGLEDELKAGEEFVGKRNLKIESFFTKFGIGVKNYSNIIKFSALVPLMSVLTNMIQEQEMSTNDVFKIFAAILLWFSFEKGGDLVKEFFSNILKSSKGDKK